MRVQRPRLRGVMVSGVAGLLLLLVGTVALMQPFRCSGPDPNVPLARTALQSNWQAPLAEYEEVNECLSRARALALPNALLAASGVVVLAVSGVRLRALLR